MNLIRKLACLLILSATLGFAAGAEASVGRHAVLHKYTKCVVSTAGYGESVAAEVGVVMRNGAGADNRLRRFEMKARLIPASPGLESPRDWASVTRKPVSEVASNYFDLWVTTGPVDLIADWNLQIKGTFDRRQRRDWHDELIVDFNESACCLTGAGLG